MGEQGQLYTLDIHRRSDMPTEESVDGDEGSEQKHMRLFRVLDKATFMMQA